MKIGYSDRLYLCSKVVEKNTKTVLSVKEMTELLPLYTNHAERGLSGKQMNRKITQCQYFLVQNKA
jgi:hypothetical protein